MFHNVFISAVEDLVLFMCLQKEAKVSLGHDINSENYTEDSDIIMNLQNTRKPIIKTLRQKHCYSIPLKRNIHFKARLMQNNWFYKV